MRVVISGYYGFGNVGDEAVLAGVLQDLRARLPEARVVVVSGNPSRTRCLHGVEAVRRGPAALRAASGAALFISGGGGLIQDATSARSAAYYLGELLAASVLARRTMLYAVGIGPLRRRWIRGLAAAVLSRVDALVVRDDDSRQLLHSLGIRRPVEVAADPAFAVPPAPPEEVADLFGALPPPRIGLVLRPWGADAHLPAVTDAVGRLVREENARAVALAFHPEVDLRVSVSAARALGAPVVAGLSPRAVLAAVGELDLLVAMRLHGVIAAVVQGVGAAGLAYDPKVRSLCSRAGLPALSPEECDPARLFDVLRMAWGRRGALRPHLRERAREMRAAAARAADVAASLVRRP
ncbi:MAG: polysaccharide pyruvyl transferase CsaB [Armatimonadota bacterium]|nr:polysaccharide pyruvyl transferase CsaB [Armatimonadota bacterium]MDR7612590.1 polysaccharide pyruvyl transferase CsaB [Armatimonadota bacterium]